MNILIIGGTKFVGRHIVGAARARGHEVTLFNRGHSNPNLFADVKQIRGDREKDLAQLKDQSWDAVVDTCGYVPRIVNLSAQALKSVTRQYIFISSISAYENLTKVGIDESYPLGRMSDESVEEVTGETYGPLKALCEKIVQETFGAKAVIVRPGLIVGPHDPTDRFTYWPVRIARGGAVLAPDRPSAPTQVIDARDLADFIVKLIETKASGAFNATGPDYSLTMGKLFETCKVASNSDAEFIYVPIEFLEQNNVVAWSDLPAWIPDRGEEAGFAYVDVSKAIQAGLKFSPLEKTVKDTLDWAQTLPADHVWKAGLSAEREAELLKLLAAKDVARQ